MKYSISILFIFLFCSSILGQKKEQPPPVIIPTKKLQKGKEYLDYHADGRLRTKAIGLENDSTRWFLYPYYGYDSLMVTIYKKRYQGISIMYDGEFELIANYHRGKKNGTFIIKENGKPILYEKWDMGKYLYALDENFKLLPDCDFPISSQPLLLRLPSCFPE